jgi:hypothetical protein
MHSALCPGTNQHEHDAVRHKGERLHTAVVCNLITGESTPDSFDLYTCCMQSL